MCKMINQYADKIKGQFAFFGRMTELIEASAGEFGRPIAYRPSARDKKEDIAKNFLLSNPVGNGITYEWYRQFLHRYQRCGKSPGTGG